MATSISLGKKETCPHRGHWRAELKTGKGGKRNIGIAVQGRGLKCKNIGFKKRQEGNCIIELKGGKIKSQRREKKK